MLLAKSIPAQANSQGSIYLELEGLKTTAYRRQSGQWTKVQQPAQLTAAMTAAAYFLRFK